MDRRITLRDRMLVGAGVNSLNRNRNGGMVVDYAGTLTHVGMRLPADGY